MNVESGLGQTTIQQSQLLNKGEKVTVAAAASFFADYGLAALFATVLVGSLGAPLPALPLFLLAGARSADDPLFGVFAFGLAIAAAMLADLAWYAAGRRFGDETLRFASRVLRSPERVRHAEALLRAARGGDLVDRQVRAGAFARCVPARGRPWNEDFIVRCLQRAGAMLWAGTSIFSGMLLRQRD